MTIRRRKYGSGYAYYDGRMIPANKIASVTQITGMLPSKNLIEWAGNTTAEYAIDHIRSLAAMCAAEKTSEALRRLQRCRYEVTDPAKKRGTEVHRLAEALIAGDEVIVPDELKGYVEAYTDFLNVMDPQPVATELIVVSRGRNKFCGTADLVADLNGVAWEGEIIPPCRWLLDLKTGEKGVYSEAALQLCGYEHATHFVAQDGQEPEERPMSWLEIARCGVVHLSSESWELRPVDTGEETWQCFRYLLWMHKRQEAMKGWIGSPAAPAQAADLAALA
jgi:hypothetical protein